MCIYLCSLDLNGTPSVKTLHIHTMKSGRRRQADALKMKTITEADLIPPYKVSLHDYKQLWHRGSIRKTIRALYENDKAAYLAAYQAVKSDFFSEQE